MTKRTNETPSMKRQAWLESATSLLRKRFTSAGYKVPDAIRISCGFPKGAGARNKSIGQCWATDASSDQHNEIFISPEIGDGVVIFGIIAHELAHAVVGVDKGHKRPFKQCAEKVGLTGKMTATVGSPDFDKWAKSEIAKIGKYPGGIIIDNGKKKQTTRLLKCECSTCGYTARVTRKWIDAAGTPVCPTDLDTMLCDDVDAEDED